jgi:hypothetical protein
MSKISRQVFNFNIKRNSGTSLANKSHFTIGGLTDDEGVFISEHNRQYKNERGQHMDHKDLFVSERINEVTRMCGREHAIYEKISGFGIALYVLGIFGDDDIMSIEDIDTNEAAVMLAENFTEIKKEAIPSDYHIENSEEKYLVVIGDPLFPKHFAVVVDSSASKPFFSKMRYFGSGFDSLYELMSSFLGEDGIGYDDIHYFRKNRKEGRVISFESKIYIVKNNGESVVCAYN